MAEPEGKVAWESLAARGEIPMEWVDARERGFVASHVERERIYDHPVSEAQAQALAAQQQHVVTAEAHARVLCAAWHQSVERVIWSAMGGQVAQRESPSDRRWLTTNGVIGMLIEARATHRVSSLDVERELRRMLRERAHAAADVPFGALLYFATGPVILQSIGTAPVMHMESV